MYSIFRRYSPTERWRSLYYGINSRQELQTKMNYLVTTEDSFLQIRNKSREVLSTYQVKNKITSKVTDPTLIAEPF